MKQFNHTVLHNKSKFYNILFKKK